MKKLLLSLVLLTGCCNIPPEAYKQANDNSIISDAFVVKMEKGQTTRAQEQALLRAYRRAWHAQDNSLNNAPLPKDMQTIGNTGPLEQNLLQALDADLAVRKAQKDLEDSLNRGNVGSVDSGTR